MNCVCNVSIWLQLPLCEFDGVLCRIPIERSPLYQVTSPQLILLQTYWSFITPSCLSRSFAANRAKSNSPKTSGDCERSKSIDRLQFDYLNSPSTDTIKYSSVRLHRNRLLMDWFGRCVVLRKQKHKPANECDTRRCTMHWINLAKILRSDWMHRSVAGGSVARWCNFYQSKSYSPISATYMKTKKSTVVHHCHREPQMKFHFTNYLGLGISYQSHYYNARTKVKPQIKNISREWSASVRLSVLAAMQFESGFDWTMDASLPRLHHTMTRCCWWTMPSTDRCNRCEHFTRTKTRFEMMRHTRFAICYCCDCYWFHSIRLSIWTHHSWCVRNKELWKTGQTDIGHFCMKNPSPFDDFHPTLHSGICSNLLDSTIQFIGHTPCTGTGSMHFIGNSANRKFNYLVKLTNGNSNVKYPKRLALNHRWRRRCRIRRGIHRSSTIMNIKQ